MDNLNRYSFYQRWEKNNSFLFLFKECIFLSIKVREEKERIGRKRIEIKKETSEQLDKISKKKKSRVKSEKQNEKEREIG